MRRFAAASPPATSRLRPFEQVVDRAEVVGNAGLAPTPHEQQMDLAQVQTTVRAGDRSAVDRGRLGELARLPVGALDCPGDHVLETTEGRPPRARWLIESKAVVVVDVGPAPRTCIRDRRNMFHPMAVISIVALEGDQTGQELLEQALRVLDPEVLRLDVELLRFDLALENRRRTKNAVCLEAAEAMRATGLGLKAATITPESADDVGSPNRILREAIDGTVIVRTGRRIAGVTPVGGVHHPISVCRLAVGDAYGAQEWREEGGEVAHRTETIRRSGCRAVAEYAFRSAD